MYMYISIYIYIYIYIFVYICKVYMYILHKHKHGLFLVHTVSSRDETAVDTEDAPDYLTVVTKPMCLDQVRD